MTQVDTAPLCAEAGAAAPLLYLIDDACVATGADSDVDRDTDNGSLTEGAGASLREWAEPLRGAGFRVQCRDTATALAAFSGPAPELPAAVMVGRDGAAAIGSALAALLAICQQHKIAVVFLADKIVVDEIVADEVAGGRRADIRARLAALRAGACRYLHKPVELSTLIRLFDSLTRRHLRSPDQIVLVDSDPQQLAAQAAVLAQAGMQVHTLSDPWQVPDTLARIAADVLVLAVALPDISGPELAVLVREGDSEHSLPILFLASGAEDEASLQALHLGGDSVLVRPLAPAHLLAAVAARARWARHHRTMRAQLQNALYEREREHLALDQHAIVSMADGSGNIIYVNDLFCRISGYSAAELLGHNHRLLKSGVHPPGFYREMWHSISRGRIWSGEICNRSKTGELYWVQSTIVPFVDERGAPYQYVSIRTNISQIKTSELAVKQQYDLQHRARLLTSRLLDCTADNADTVLGDALQQVADYLQMDSAALLAPAVAGHAAVAVHSGAAGTRAGPAIDSARLAALAPGLWRQVCSGAPVLIARGDRSPDAAALVQQLQCRALLLYPVPQGSAAPAVLVLRCASACQWGEREQGYLALVTTALGGALERVRHERALSASRQMLHATLESTQDAILAVNNQGEVIFYNGNFVRLWQIPAALLQVDVQEAALLDYAAPQLRDGDGFKDAVRAIYASDQASQDLLHFSDGRLVERYSHAMWHGAVKVGRVWSFHDITATKLAEISAASSKERLRRGQIFSNIGTWEWHIQTGDLFWTERIAPLFGYAEGELETSFDNFIAAVHPHDRSRVLAAIDASVREDAVYDIEHRVVWPDGTVRWLLERGAVQRDSAGLPLQMTGVVQDITERILVQQSLQVFKHIVSSVIDGVVTIDRCGVIQSVNPAANRIFGYSGQTLVGHAFNRLLPVACNNHGDYLGDCLHGGNSRMLNQQMEMTGQRADGSRFPLEIAISDIELGISPGILPGDKTSDEAGNTAGNERLLVALLRDISARKQTEQELLAARDEAERANQAKSEFLSSMSHELRTPMNAILGFSQLLHYDADLSAENHDSVREILKAGNHLLQLINEVLDLAKIEAGYLALSLEPVALDALLDECCSLIRPQAEARAISISRHCPGGPVVRADHTRLKQVILNLLSNAIKYNTEAGRVAIATHSVDAEWLLLSVTDTGIGIAAARLPELFQPFNRLGAEKTTTEGTGIGLTITRRIVELMGGDITVQSRVGAGSCFTVRLPLVAQAPQLPAPAVGSGTAAPEVAQAPRQTVLYIEDNPANLKLVTQILARRPHIDLYTAHTPELGLTLARARAPQLILLDINMPGMDGYQVLRLLQAEPALCHIPVFAITANAMLRDIERGLAAGFAEYLTKPLNMNRLLDVVDTCLRAASDPLPGREH